MSSEKCRPFRLGLVNNHGIDYMQDNWDVVAHIGFPLPVPSQRKNDKKCKYIFMFPNSNSAPQVWKTSFRDVFVNAKL